MRRALLSVLSQTLPPVEILLIDDNRGEEGEPYSEGLMGLTSLSPLIRLIKTEGGHGAQWARNTGIRNAAGDFVAFLDDDDEWMPKKLEEELKCLEKHPEAAMCFCNGYIVDERTDPPAIKEEDYLSFPKVVHYNDMLEGDLIGSTSKPLIRKEVFDEVGLFDVDFPARQDYEMWLRITRAHPAVGVDKRLIRYHLAGNGQISMNRERCIEGHKMLYQKYRSDIDMNRKARFNVEFYLAHYYMKMGDHAHAWAYYTRSLFISPAGFMEKLKIRMNRMGLDILDMNKLIMKLRGTAIYDKAYMPLRNAFVKLVIQHDPYIYTCFRYFRVMKRKLHLNPPVTYTEKIQWRKLYDGNPLFSECADKVRVRDYIRNKLGFTGDGNGTLKFPKWYGVYDDARDIDFDALPNEFVLKTNHASAQVIVVKDKEKLNRAEAIDTLNKWLKVNFYYAEGERLYRDIVPKIICEELLHEEITDYRIYCFNGKPKLIRVTAHDHTSPSGYVGETYNTRWVPAPFTWKADSVTKEQKKPENLDALLEAARALSADFNFVRVDLYSIGGEVYFSEMTFTPDSGLQPGLPYEWDKKIGSFFEV